MLPHSQLLKHILQHDFLNLSLMEYNFITYASERPFIVHRLGMWGGEAGGFWLWNGNVNLIPQYSYHPPPPPPHCHLIIRSPPLYSLPAKTNHPSFSPENYVISQNPPLPLQRWRTVTKFSHYVGAHIRTGTTAVQQTFNLKKLFKHEGFSMSHLRKDIALLQLDGEVQLSDKVNTVCLPPKGSRIPPGTECFITGKFAYRLEKIIFCGNCICQLYFCEFSI